MPPDLTLGRDELIALFRELARELAAAGAVAEVTVVGGAHLALRGLTRTTLGVDTVTRLSPELEAAAQRVATHRDVAPTWLSDAASGFAPTQLGAEPDFVAFDDPNLRVVMPEADYVFLMKLNAARSVDIEDLVLLWPLCSFVDARDAVDRYRDAYPAAIYDEYLESLVLQIAERAERRRQAPT